MRVFEFVNGDDGTTEILTEQEIIDQYYHYWSTKTLLNCPDEPITRERCIEDWCIVHWATEIRVPI
jgi:hypothetical protein